MTPTGHLFFDADLNLPRRDAKPDYAVDPRARPWLAVRVDRRHVTTIATLPVLALAVG